MKSFFKNNNRPKLFLVLFFVVALIEIILEAYSCTSLIFVFKPLVPAAILVLYGYTSIQKNAYFFAIVAIAMFVDVFFVFKTEKMLFLGLIFLFIRQLLLIYYILKLIKLKDYVPLVIASFPFLFLFFYLLCISNQITVRTYCIVFVQNILISILGGIFLTYYMLKNKRKNTWFLIFGVLFVSQYFIVFLEKYYLSDLSAIVFRPIAMFLSAAAYFSFYKFVVFSEKQEDIVL